MAIWQFTIALVPRTWALANEYNSAPLTNEEWYDTSIAWAAARVNLNDFIGAFDDLLPRGKSWDKDLTTWGHEKSTDIQLWQKDAVFDSAEFRLDLRENSQEFLVRICETISALDCSCFIPEMNLIVDPSPTELLELAHKSRAAAFIKAPQDFLQSLSQNTESQ